MNQCAKTYDLIQKELDGELTTQELQLLNEHCAQCLTCQSLREEFKETTYILENLPTLNPGPQFVMEVMDAINKKSLPKTNNLENKLTGFLTGLIICFSSSIIIIGSFLTVLLMGGLMYFNSSFLKLDYLFFDWKKYFIDIPVILGKTLVHVFSPNFIFLLFLVSMLSFIILIILLYSRRIVNYEN